MRQAYVVQWQTPSMPAPAFWYYAKRENAQAIADSFSVFDWVSVRPAVVPCNTPLLDEAKP